LSHSLSITHLLKLESITPDLVLPSARLYQRTPWFAPQAYLHIVLKPAQPAEVDRVCEELRVPDSWRTFLQQQNGAGVFFTALDLYGVRETNALMVRDTSDRKPFDIADHNRPGKLAPDGEWLCIGSYGYFRTQVMLSRKTGEVRVQEQNTSRVIATWASVEPWLSQELERLQLLFSEDGHLLADKKYTDPACAFLSA
jgi:hypothetical protein